MNKDNWSRSSISVDAETLKKFRDFKIKMIRAGVFSDVPSANEVMQELMRAYKFKKNK